MKFHVQLKGFSFDSFLMGIFIINMDVREKLRMIYSNFYKELSEKTKGIFIDSYTCEENCYESSKELEQADTCANICRSQANIVRDLLQTEYNSAFVRNI